MSLQGGFLARRMLRVWENFERVPIPKKPPVYNGMIALTDSWMAAPT
jgi:hypothetical protein